MPLITIPEYFTRFIDPKIDLNVTPKICCPFHQEDTPSFSYSAEKGVWRCFGACKFGGDVIAMHQKHYHLRNREEAEKSLYKLLGYTETVNPMEKLREPPVANEREVVFKSAYAKALSVARTPDDWDALDYIMGQYPQDVHMLEAFYNERRLDEVNRLYREA